MAVTFVEWCDQLHKDLQSVDGFIDVSKRSG